MIPKISCRAMEKNFVEIKFNFHVVVELVALTNKKLGIRA